MRQFMYVVILVIMLASWLSSPETHLLPSAAKYLPDIVSMLIIVYVFAAGVRQSFQNVAIKYWLVLAAVGFVVVCGPIVNNEDVGPIVAGTRYYLRAIPLFFVPMVYEFSDADLKKYLKLIMALSALQCPVSIQQRLSGLARGEFTGDIVVGTLNGSGVVTVFLICVLCVMTGLMLRGRMSKLWFAACFVPLLISVSINETKVTIFLLPFALLVTFLTGAPKGRRIRGVLQGIAAIAIAGIIFVPLYNSLNRKDDGTKYFTVQEFIEDPTTINKYLNTDKGVGADKDAGRGDALVAPFHALGSDPVKAAFGLGIGNVSFSGLGPQYSGHYQKEYWVYALVISMSAFLFEIGILGTFLAMILQGMVLWDALWVSKHDEGLTADLALGFVGAWVTVTIGLFYSTVHTFESISFMFWFFAGLFAARRRRLVRSRAKVKKPSYFAQLAPMKLKAG